MKRISIAILLLFAVHCQYLLVGVGSATSERQMIGNTSQTEGESGQTETYGAYPGGPTPVEYLDEVRLAPVDFGSVDFQSGPELSSTGPGSSESDSGASITPFPSASSVNNLVNNLATGRLVYNPPTEMTVNITKLINATITEENGTGEEIKVSPVMEVYLNGSAFHIYPITKSRQFIANKGPTTWQWDVIPFQAGNQTLDLMAYVIIPTDYKHEEQRAIAKNKIIFIKVNPSKISINSTPSGANVLLDQEDRGKTPTNIFEISAGQHKLNLGLSGYIPVETIVIGKAGITNLTYPLTPEPSPFSNTTVLAAVIGASATIIAAIIAVILKKNK